MFIVVFPKHTTTPVSPSQGGVKLLAIRTVEYCSAVKRNELMTHTAWWVTLGGTKLSERSQTQKATHRILPFLQHSGKQMDAGAVGGAGLITGSMDILG